MDREQNLFGSKKAFEPRCGGKYVEWAGKRLRRAAGAGGMLPVQPKSSVVVTWQLGQQDPGQGRGVGGSVSFGFAVARVATQKGRQGKGRQGKGRQRGLGCVF